MRSVNYGIVTLLVLASVLAGCAFVDYPETADVKFDGDFETNGSTFTMTGTVFPDGHVLNRSDVFHNVSIGLYTENGTKLCNQPIGDLRVYGGTANVSLSWHAIPHYVTIESPEFWTKDMDVETYANTYENRGGGKWREIGVSSPGGYPVETSGHDAPECGD